MASNCRDDTLIHIFVEPLLKRSVERSDKQKPVECRCELNQYRYFRNTVPEPTAMYNKIFAVKESQVKQFLEDSNYD